MPIYEYECAHCGHTLEKLQKISDPPLTECPQCHQHELRKLVSAAAFHLKGSGWYATDFKDKPKTGKETSDTGAEKKPDNTNSDKPATTESKTTPEKTADPAPAKKTDKTSTE